jgi:hypothetical protein
MEANPNVYRLASHTLDDLVALAFSSHISNMIDWQRVKEELERKDAVARDLTIRAATPSASSLSSIFSPIFSILEWASTPSRSTGQRSARGKSGCCTSRCSSEALSWPFSKFCDPIGAPISASAWITATEESATGALGAPVRRERRSFGLSDQIPEVSPRQTHYAVLA